MKKDYADITIVIDRSGSMQSIRTDAEGGINQYIEDRKKEAGTCTLSIVQFDTEYEFVHRGVPVKDVPHYSLVPRGSTALLDAVGRAIIATGKRLAGMPENERPETVLFVIVTDGHENSSKEFTKSQIKSMIEIQTDQYKWAFTYLGANQDAFAEAGAIGIRSNAAMLYQAEGRSPMNAYRVASVNTDALRKARAAGNLDAGMNFSDEDRKAANKTT